MFQDFNPCASALFVSIFHLFEAGIADANISIYGKYISKIEIFCEQTILWILEIFYRIYSNKRPLP